MEEDIEEATKFEVHITRDLSQMEEFIKKFMGDPTALQQVDEAFDATVHKNENLCDIENFSYLKGYLGGAAEKCLVCLKTSSRRI